MLDVRWEAILQQLDFGRHDFCQLVIQWQYLPNKCLRLNDFTTSGNRIDHSTINDEIVKSTLDWLDDGKVDDDQSAAN